MGVGQIVYLLLGFRYSPKKGAEAKALQHHFAILRYLAGVTGKVWGLGSRD